MGTKDNNYLALIRGLKANNIEVNMPKLQASSTRIVSLLGDLKSDTSGAIEQSIESGVAIIKKSIAATLPEEKINCYIEFGETYKYMLDDMANNKKYDYDTKKKIAMAYFDIVRKTSDSRVVDVANSIAETLKKYKPE